MYRKYGLSILLIFIIALFQKFLAPLASSAFGQFVYIVCNAGLLFSLGLSFNTFKKTRGHTWVKKVIVSLILIFFIFYQLDIIMVMHELVVLFDFIGLSTFIINLIYIYCGWIFFS